VAAVAWTVLVRIRMVFEQRDQEETALFVSQFQREFQHRSAEVAGAVDHVAASERVRAMAFELAQTGDGSPYLNEAQTLVATAPHLVIFPGLAILLAVLGFNLLGEGLHAAFDPRAGKA